MEKEGMGLYARIAGLGAPKSYPGKVLLVAFLSAQAPLLAVALYLLLGSSAGLGEALRALALLAAVTLAGMAVTLLALRALLAPIGLASAALEAYLEDRTRPGLPTGFPDEAGRLMAAVRRSVEHLDSTITSLEGLSGSDPLTGLPNRRAGEERLAEDFGRARRGGGTLTLALADVNRFKTINDTHGHQAGDACIRHVAQVMRSNVGEGDWLARWGGDEFVLALWDASVFAPPGAVLGRISKALRESPARLPGGEELVLSVSVGARRYAGEDDVRELLAKADAAMYEAKREGRTWVIAD
ncbi:MAG TPA: GGDEF domain-containing protein [Rubrobacter sp.]|nr:GGDEF domain-containing protein [Rubrobacter sp.]